MKTLLSGFMAIAMMTLPISSNAVAHSEKPTGQVHVTDEGYKVNLDREQIEKLVRATRGRVSQEAMRGMITSQVVEKLSDRFHDPAQLAELSIEINCEVSYPPLRIKCKITLSW